MMICSFRFTILALAAAAAMISSGCRSDEIDGGEGEPRAAVRYGMDEVQQMFLKAYRAGDRAGGLEVASPQAVARVSWDGDPEATLSGDSILSGDGDTEIAMVIQSDGHVGATIVDVIVSHRAH